jgi:peptidoglycan L-alanyl-D-glutamate endopeptidase CwlK
MPKFSKSSLDKLYTCDERLIQLFKIIIQYYDCTILEGHRNEEDQNQAFKEGKSKLRFPDSLHNRIPSLAIDVAPHPIDWSNRNSFYHFAGFVLGVARQMGLNIRWGGDWNQDNKIEKQQFDDLPHFELI